MPELPRPRPAKFAVAFVRFMNILNTPTPAGPSKSARIFMRTRDKAMVTDCDPPEIAMARRRLFDEIALLS
jgi:hypothetical protein